MARTQNGKLGEPKHIRFAEDDERQLQKLADMAERTFAAEVRVAVRAYLESPRKGTR